VPAVPETADRAPAAPLPTLGDYELLAVIGRGGMGAVFEARQKSLNRTVALKMIRVDHAAFPAEGRRFRNEAEMAAGLDHPNIVPVYEVAEHAGQLYFSMKRIEGGSLAQHLDRFAADPKAAARLVAQVARAVHHAHQRGVLHRDLKPSNILLDTEGQAHITDFGLAKRLERDSSLTQSGALVGTPSYMAPEQASGEKGAVTTAADVYGLGAVLYALLTGRAPFRGETVLETLEQLKACEPEPPRGNPKVDRDLETICLKCLDKEPQRRYESAQALAEDLERWLNGEPIRARRIGMWRRIGKWIRRRPGLAALGAVSVVALAGLLVGSFWYNGRLRAALAEAARERDAAREQRRLARAAVDDMYIQVADKWLGRQPRLTEVQREFLVKALRFYQGAMKEQGKDLEVRRGAFYAAQYAANIHHQLGEYREAEQAFRQAISIVQELADDFPGEAQYRASLANVHNSLANLLSNAGRCPEAEEEYWKGLAILKRLVDEFPAECLYRKVYGGIYNNLGELARKTGRPRQAEEGLRQAVAVWDRAAADFPRDATVQEAAAQGHTNLANTLKRSIALEAEEHCRRALRIMRRLAAEHPEHREYCYHLGVAYYALSLILDPTEQPREVARGPEAMQCRREAVAVFRKLAEDFPRVLEYRRRLALAQGGLGALLMAEQQTESAVPVLGEAVDSYRKLVRDAPGVPEYRSELAYFQQTLGQLLFRKGQAHPAEEAFLQVRDLNEKLVADFPAEAKYRAELALLLLTCPAAKLRDDGRAVEQARQAVQLAPRMRDYWYLLGRAYYRARDWRASREALLKLEELPGGGYGESWFFLALAEWRLGHKEEARRWYDKAVQWAERYGPQKEELHDLRADAGALLGIQEQVPKKKEGTSRKR
jgi:tetratricopeptide (TPR) repeat protein